MFVKVKGDEVTGIPVLHNGQDFFPGDVLEIEEDQFNESIFEETEEVPEKVKRTSAKTSK